MGADREGHKVPLEVCVHVCVSATGVSKAELEAASAAGMYPDERLRDDCVHVKHMLYCARSGESGQACVCVCVHGCVCEEVIEADNGEVRPLTLSALTRTCDSIQASSAVSATHRGGALMTADSGQTPPLLEAPKHRRAHSRCFYSPPTI